MSTPIATVRALCHLPGWKVGQVGAVPLDAAIEGHLDAGRMELIELSSEEADAP